MYIERNTREENGELFKSDSNISAHLDSTSNLNTTIGLILKIKFTCVLYNTVVKYASLFYVFAADFGCMYNW